LSPVATSVAPPGQRTKRWLAVTGAVLSAVSFALVFYAAGEEPFVFFRWSELALNVGLCGVVFALFASWGVACVRNFQRTPSRTVLGTVLLCASVSWTALNLFYLGSSVYGYAQDMTNPSLRALR